MQIGTENTKHLTKQRHAIVCSMHHVSLTAWNTADLHFQTIVVGESFTPEFVDRRTSLVRTNIPISEHRVWRVCVFRNKTHSGNSMDAKERMKSLPRNISEWKVNPKNWRWFWVGSSKILFLFFFFYKSLNLSIFDSAIDTSTFVNILLIFIE